jgi:prephenate dehydrogenase
MAMKELAEVIKIRSITVTEPEQHDKMIAFTSQLPHVLAGAYVKSPSCTSRKGFSAGSYMDVSRVATADEKLWTELFLQNRENLCNEIDILIKNLVDYRDAIKSCDRQALEALIKQSSEIKKRDNL